MKRNNPPYFNYMPEYTNFREMVKESVKKYAGRTVYSYRVRPSDPSPVRVSYTKLGARVRAIGTAAIDIGLPSAHVALIGKLSYPWICVYLSMLSVGAVLVPLDPDWSEEDLADTVERAECTTVFFAETIRSKMDAVAAKVSGCAFYSLDGKEGDTLESLYAAGKALVAAGDTCFDTQPIDPYALAELVFTSGTTGKGKGVMLNQKALLSNLHGAFSILTIESRTVGVLPPHHTYGSTISLLSAFCNGTDTYISSGIKYLLNELAEQKPEYLILVPLYLETFYRRILATANKTGKEKILRRMIQVSNCLRKVGIDLRRTFFAESVLSAFGGELRKVVCGGAPLSQEIIDFFDSIGVQVLNGYGITECSPLISANRVAFSADHSVGVPICDEEVRIDAPNEDGEGEICVRGPHVMMGYFKDEEATARAIDADGFFHTGDIGKYENDLIYITGRLKNLIILSNGKNVYPEEIESELLTVPGVSEIVVYEGVSHRQDKAHAIVAEIYPDKAYLEQNGITNAHAYFSGFVNEYNRRAVPYKKVELVRIREEEFPKNTLRKIMRFKIDRTIE